MARLIRSEPTRHSPKRLSTPSNLLNHSLFAQVRAIPQILRDSPVCLDVIENQQVLRC